MSLFDGLPPDNGARTVVDAVKRIEDQLARLPGPGPHSLCEVGASEADYQWLCRWAAKLSYGPVTLTRWMAGALALLLASEAARREAQEGHVWPVMQGRFESQVHGKFFTANGQPTSTLKDLLEEAATRLNLRHVFGRQDKQEWYVSIYLQFGFTQKGMANNLPDWLARKGLTESILHLRDPDKGSKSFHQLWSALRNYRRDFLTKEQIRHVIGSSPWVLPSWEEDLLRLARESLSLGTESDLLAGPMEVEVSFLLLPRLHWEPPEEPGFCCEVTNLDGLGLTADHYHLRMGSMTLATLFRQPEGTYLPDRQEVSLPCTLAEVVVSVMDPDGRAGATQTVKLWDIQEDINVVDGEGRRIDGSMYGRFNPRAGYVLHTAADLVVHPPQPIWRRLGGPGNRLLTLLSPGWPEDLQVRTESGIPLWNPQISQTTVPKQVPAWADRVQVRWLSTDAPIYLGQSLRPVVEGLAPGVCLTYVRLGGQPLPFDPVRGNLGEVIVTPELALAGLHFLLGLAYGDQQAQVRSTLRVTVLGAAQCTERGWEPLCRDGTLTVREAAENVYRLFLPADVGEQKVALMEGSLYSSSAGKRPRPLGRLAGLGAPLVVRKAPYNCPDNLCQLADAVVDHGIVRYVESPEADGVFHVRLTRPIRPGQEHRVVCWVAGQAVELIGPERIDILDEGRTWRVPCAIRESADRAVVAIAYRGSWCGSGWASGLDKLLPDTEQSPISPRQTAALIRWCHLPLLRTLHAGQQPVLEPYVRSHAADVLAVWLFNKGLEGLELCFDEDADRSRAAWAALRALFEGWQPPREQTQAIIDLFAQVEKAEPLYTVTKRLLHWDPLLAGRLILAQLTTQGSTPSSRNEAIKYVRVLRRMAAGVRSNASDSEVRQRQTDALEEAARTMRVDSKSAVDPNFVKEGIADPAVNTLQAGALNRVKATNLAVALQSGYFREYLGLRVLERVASLL
jgi:hypothetical protein